MIHRSTSRWSQFSAAAVHLYTASGAVLAFLMVLAAIQGNAVQALWISLITLIVDGTDGSLARRFRVSEMLPSFDGRRVDAKTDDNFFLGFPSYWNVIAFYAIVLNLSPMTVGAVLIFCSIMVFVPIRYLYPTRTKAFRSITLTLSAGWLVSFVLILLQMPNPNPLLVNFSLLYMVYYVVMSLVMTYTTMRHKRL